MPRFRFSLRTLLIAALLIASGATLWWNWDPWYPVGRVETNEPFSVFEFSPRDKYFYATESIPREHVERIPLVLFSAQTSEPAVRIEIPGPIGCAAVTSGEKYALVSETHSLEGVDVYSIATRSKVAFPGISPGERIKEIVFSAQDNFVAYTSSLVSRGVFARNLVHVPDLRVVSTFVGTNPIFSSNETMMAWWEGVPGRFESTFFLTDCASGFTLQCWNLPGVAGACFFSPDDRLIAIGCYGAKDLPQATLLYDCESGKRIGFLKGNPRCFSKDGQRLLTHLSSEDSGEDLIFGWTVAALEQPPAFMKRGANWEYIASNDLIATFDREPETAWDARTGAEAWKFRRDGGTTYMSDEYMFQLGFLKWSGIRDLKTGQLIHDFGDFRWRRAFPKIRSVAIPNHGSEFLTESAESDSASAPGRITLWRKHRPPEWWGVVWLPVFWSTAGLAGALVWSVVKRESRK